MSVLCHACGYDEAIRLTMVQEAGEGATMNGVGGITPAMRDNPYSYYAMARQMAPVLYNDTMGAWNVFGYEDCRTVLRNPALFSSDASRFMAGVPRESQTMLRADPPRHTQLRNLVNLAFTPRRVAALEPRIRRITSDLLDTALPVGRIEIIEQFAIPLPVVMIAELLGVPPEDQAVFKQWSNEIVNNLGREFGSNDGRPPALQQARDEFIAYFGIQIEQHRQNPKDDLIGALLAAEIDGEKLSPEELLSFCILLLVAGNETTTNLIGNAVRCFLDQPAGLERVRDTRSLVPSAIEEVLRYRSPVQATSRFVVEETALGGQTLNVGQQVIVWLAAANRDPAEFPDPDRFDVARQPNRHLAFGLGIHFCLGAPLARLEARVAIEELLRRIPEFGRADGAALEPVAGFIMHGVKHLPLAFAPVAVGSSG